jgi:HEAT repeat protein
MLQSADGMRRCAAAMVLAELKPKDPEVVRALGTALRDANQLLSRYILEAFEAIGTRAVVPHVLPMLDAPEVEVKLRAAGIIARAGGEMVGELRKQFQKANPLQKRVLLDILARIHTRESLALILETLFDPDVELGKEACQAVRRHISDATPKDRAALHRQVIQFMNSARVRKDERVLTSCLLLVGALAAPEATRVLLHYAQPRHPISVRRHALLGLKGQEFAGRAAKTVAAPMFKFLAEPDYLNIVQNALDILEKISQRESFDKLWPKYLTSPHPSVRTFAARKLAATDNPATNQLLLKMLRGADAQLSEIAAGALARHKGATKRLLAELIREKQPEGAWRLARILKPHSETFDKPTLKKLRALAARELRADSPRQEALLYLLRHANSHTADTVLREVGLHWKKQRKWARAVACLKQLQRSEAFDDGLRFELAICDLKQSPKDITPHLRAEDYALRGLQPLVANKKFKLLERLKKEKALDATDLFYVGFHFSEGLGDEQRFGRAVLEQVAKRWPGSKEGKAARQKLKATAPAAATPAG